MSFARFMAGPIGRGIRILAGIALAAWGYSLQSATGTIALVVGVVVFAAGAFNLCLFAPIFGGPFRGADVR